MLSELTESTFWTKETLDELVRVNEAVVVLVTKAECSVADAVEPKLEHLLEQRFPRVRFLTIYLDHAPQLVSELQVIASPTVICWFDGKESARFVRAFSLEAVAQALERPYGLLFG